jgi:hypothetical protein
MEIIEKWGVDGDSEDLDEIVHNYLCAEEGFGE